MDPDQTALTGEQQSDQGSALFAILSAFFGHMSHDMTKPIK